MSGRFIAVVGPSGVGKDTVMAALAEADPRLSLARRVITRPPDAGGEAFDSVSVDTFARLKAAGDFALSWEAHGLHYGIPASVDRVLTAGGDVLANLSRRVLPEARARFPEIEVIVLTASPDILARRLSSRGRESPEEIARRLAREEDDLPDLGTVHVVDNSGALTETVERIRAILYPK